MGDKMFSRFKTLAIFAAVVAVVLSVLVLAKYFNAGLAFAVDNSHRLAAALPNLTNLSEHLDTGQYRSYLKDIALVAFLFLLLLWRVLLLRRSQN
jgi:hypothetical protein